MRRMNEEFENDRGVVSRYRRHLTGDGWVSPRARLADGVTVSANTYVEAGARIGKETWIGEGSWIDADAVIGQKVFIGSNVHVGAGAEVGHGAWLGSHAKIGAGATVEPGVRIDRDAGVPEHGVAHRQGPRTFGGRGGSGERFGKAA